MTRAQLKCLGPPVGRAPLAPLMAVATGMLTAAGCTVEDSYADWSRERFEHASYEQVFEAGRYALSQWFQVEEADPGAGRLRSRPAEDTQRGDTGRLRDGAIPTDYRVRRQATVRLHARGDVVVAECIVTRQRLDTADHRLMAQQRQFDEAPTRTPIQGEAGVTAEQSQVWTDVGRDRRRERDVLDAMRQRVYGPAREPAASSPAE